MGVKWANLERVYGSKNDLFASIGETKSTLGGWGVGGPCPSWSGRKNKIEIFITHTILLLC